MKVLISGGEGFLGPRLCRNVLAYGELVGADEEKERVSEVVLLSREDPPPDLLDDARVRAVCGEALGAAAAASCQALVDCDGMVVFHFPRSASVGAGGDLDFDLWAEVNAGTRGLLEACQRRRGTRLVLVSSGAAFRHTLATSAGDAVASANAGAGAGAGASMGGGDGVRTAQELLASEYARRGIVDVRIARLPTVVPCPRGGGGGSAAWLDAFSAVVREPLQSRGAVLPVRADVRLPMCGFRVAVQNLLRLAQLPRVIFGRVGSQSVTMPSLNLSLADLQEGLRNVLRDPGALPMATFQPDEVLSKRIEASRMPFDAAGALALGMLRDSSADAIVADYVDQYASRDLLVPVLEVPQEPRHNIVLSTSAVRVVRADVPPGDDTIMHAHRADTVYFFLTKSAYRNTLGSGEVDPVGEVRAGEVRYGPHCDCAYIHKYKLSRNTPCLVLACELAAFAPATEAAGATLPSVPEGLRLAQEKRGARVWELHVEEGARWLGLVPFPRMLWVARDRARVSGTLGDRLLMPGDIFYREGPLDMEMEVVLGAKGGRSSRRLARHVLWVVECL